MPARLDERAQRVRLVEQHLREGEAIDGLFDVDLGRVVAVTSERLMIVSGGGPRGWAQTSIPWHVVTAVLLGEAESGDITTVGVVYNRQHGRMTRNGENAVTSVRADLQSDGPDSAQRMSALINLRRALVE